MVQMATATFTKSATVSFPKSITVGNNAKKKTMTLGFPIVSARPAKNDCEGRFVSLGEGRIEPTDTSTFSPLCLSRFLRYDLPVFQHIDWGAMHLCRLCGNLCRAAQGTTNARGEMFVGFPRLLCFHGHLSSKRGERPEFSYTVQESAKGR